jgi:SAM-dependent methyltransferase
MIDYGYRPERLPQMIAMAARQQAKDALFVEELARYFVPGPILEIGAGCGQISELLISRGFDATASDIEQFLVDYVASRGVPARIADALNLREGLDRPYPNLLATGMSTLITPDLAVVRQTYESIAAALPSGGRFIFVLPSLWGEPWSKPRDHRRIAQETGLRLVADFRNQVLPSTAYRRTPRPILRVIERTIGRLVGIRTVLVFAAPSDGTGRPAPV